MEETQSVLVVDDDPELREVLQWLLQDEGLDTSTAADGQEALRQATRAKPALVLLDIGLPVLDGEGFAARLHDHYGREAPPIIVITASGRAAETAKRIGAIAYVHKPFEVDNLVALVRRHLSGD